MRGRRPEKVLAWQIEQLMAKRMKTSRAAVDRLLDPANASVTTLKPRRQGVKAARGAQTGEGGLTGRAKSDFEVRPHTLMGNRLARSGASRTFGSHVRYISSP